MSWFQKFGWALMVIGGLMHFLPIIYRMRSAMNPVKMEDEIGKDNSPV